MLNIHPLLQPFEHPLAVPFAMPFAHESHPIHSRVPLCASIFIFSSLVTANLSPYILVLT